MAGVDDIIGGWVKEAEKTGEVKRLPGYGKPLDLDEDRHVPAKYRMAYRVLKNAGYARRGTGEAAGRDQRDTSGTRRGAGQVQACRLTHGC